MTEEKPMTVGELIETLKCYPTDAKVIYRLPPSLSLDSIRNQVNYVDFYSEENEVCLDLG